MGSHPSLNTVGYLHEFYSQVHRVFIGDGINKPIHKRVKGVDYTEELTYTAIFDLNFSISGRVIKLHANDFISAKEAIDGYVVKIDLLKDIIERALSQYGEFYSKDTPFIIKEFLNEDKGPSAIYTSTVAISYSPTHYFFFELSSCDHKARLYFPTEAEFVSTLTKLSKLLTKCSNDAKAIGAKYLGATV